MMITTELKQINQFLRGKNKNRQPCKWKTEKKLKIYVIETERDTYAFDSIPRIMYVKIEISR